MIRLAEPQDYNAVRDMVCQFVQTTPYGAYPIDLSKVDEVIDGLARGGPLKSIILISVIDGVPVGLLMATTSEFLFNRKKVASEIAWWVNPICRRDGVRLKKAYEYWAEHIVKADYCHMSSLNTDKVNRYLERTGYRLTECTYVKEF